MRNDDSWKRLAATGPAFLGIWLASARPAPAAQGDLTYADCVADTATHGCTDVISEPLTSPMDRTIAHLFRDGNRSKPAAIRFRVARR